MGQKRSARLTVPSRASMKQSRTGRQKYVLNSSCPNGFLIESALFAIGFHAKAQRSQSSKVAMRLLYFSWWLCTKYFFESING